MALSENRMPQKRFQLEYIIFPYFQTNLHWAKCKGQQSHLGFRGWNAWNAWNAWNDWNDWNDWNGWN